MRYRYKHGDRPLQGYTIRRGVGRGAFGEVYFAVSDAGREVALKSILGDEEIELRGVRQCINLKNPHLVSLFDVRTGDDGSMFVIMEYVSGMSLRELLDEHPEGLGVQEAGFLIRDTAKGLSYLHERGIVHRDLKPENIFYEDGYVKIGDYGLSKFINASQQSGQTLSVGTVHYMAPEIGSGNYHKGIDIYALGIILYELLTGEVPFKGDSFGEILMKHLTQSPDLGAIEEPFRSAVDGALRKDPKERFSSVESMVKGIFEDSQLNVRLSAFDPSSLSQAAKKVRIAQRRRQTAREHDTAPSPTPSRSKGRRVLSALYNGARRCVMAVVIPFAVLARVLRFLVNTLLVRPLRFSVRLLWLVVGSCMIAAALFCLLAPALDDFSGEETLLLLASSVALGFLGFGVYRLGTKG